MKSDVRIGKITAPTGIKGEVRVYSYTDELTRFSHIKNVIINGREKTIESVRFMKDMAVIKLSGINTRNDAETLRGKELFLSRDNMYEMPEDSYLLDDIIGMDVVSEDGTHIGKLTDVIDNPAHDLFEITKGDGTSFLLPSVKEFILDVDPDTNTIKVHLIEGLG